MLKKKEDTVKYDLEVSQNWLDILIINIIYSSGYEKMAIQLSIKLP